MKYKFGIKIETFNIAGRYQHKVYDIGIGPDRRGELSNDIVEAQKKVNEKLWDEMPEGATSLVSIIQYECSKKPKRVL